MATRSNLETEISIGKRHGGSVLNHWEQCESRVWVSPQGNMQRCKLVMDQITEAREAMMKVLDHRERVLKLLNKNSSTKKLHKLHKRKDRAWRGIRQPSQGHVRPRFAEKKKPKHKSHGNALKLGEASLSMSVLELDGVSINVCHIKALPPLQNAHTRDNHSHAAVCCTYTRGGVTKGRRRWLKKFNTQYFH